MARDEAFQSPDSDDDERRQGDRRQGSRRLSDSASFFSERLAEGPVVITGICGRLGRRLARQLHRDRHVIGVDRRPFHDRPKDIEFHQIDIRRKKAQDIFRNGEVAALVHLGVMHNPRGNSEEHHSWNVAGFQKMLEWVRRYNVPKLVLISSANVYGPRPDNPQFLTEEAPLLGAGAFSEIRDLVELDMLAQSFFWKHPQTETVVLRPTHILGTVRNAPSNYLRLKVVPTLMGFDPMIQVVHQDDVVQAIRLALRPGARGIFNIAGPTPVSLSHALRTLGRATLPLPHMVARRGIERLWNLRMTSFPAPELDYIRYVCMVDDSRAREVLGYEPRFDLTATLKAVDEERWV
ncbi:MAG: SDR family oxidoreductase [Polyangiaceae bacterium]|nr:SDR family oxidoreductase [Polyangiaceae bacterium]MCB9608423.1 SDR family oxidoreductase [Polyangiaceae bacterium]